MVVPGFHVEDVVAVRPDPIAGDPRVGVLYASGLVQDLAVGAVDILSNNSAVRVGHGQRAALPVRMIEIRGSIREHLGDQTVAPDEIALRIAASVSNHFF